VRLRALAVACALGLMAFPSAALACNGWSQPGMQSQLMCIVCHERIDISTSPFAAQVKQHLARWCTQGWTADRVRNTLVAEFGTAILASPPKHGFDLLAWVVPAAALLIGAAVAIGLTMAWSQRRRGPPGAAGGGLDPEMERRIDSDLAGFE
jgi:cytochrome c-type biogenesis protein CcmH